ncbi:MAG: sigma 54-interacting transcriptional regulator, partial [Aquincola sp.]|nr:sigma 54-interacting transcriptional regulator [Aquincola sp.]
MHEVIGHASGQQAPGKGNPQALIKEGRFREDLYYRLDVIPIHLPPLRERLEDVQILVQHFLAKFSQTTGKHIPGINPEGDRTFKMIQEWRG